MAEWDWSGEDPEAAAFPKRRRWPIALAALVAISAVGVAVWRNFFSGAETPAAAGGADAATSPDGGALASLAEGDALLRRLAAGWSNAPELLAWLAEADIVRRLTAATALIADGDSPRPMLSFLKVNGAFEAFEEPVKAPKRPKPKKRGRHRHPPPVPE